MTPAHYKFLVVIFLTGILNMAAADTFVSDDLITSPVPARYNICHGGTCEYIAYASLKDLQWQSIRSLFFANESPTDERNSIRMAIARMEELTGRQTDTYNDRAENKTDKQTGHYMDCIDESTNTSLYLTMMQSDGLLRWHRVEDRQTRGYFFRGWPHTTAVIKDMQSGKQYAVDSWFLDNGEPPFIIPVEEWNDGWRPGKNSK